MILGTGQLLQSIEHNTGTYSPHYTEKEDIFVVVITAIFFILVKGDSVGARYVLMHTAISPTQVDNLVKMFQQSRLPSLDHLRWHAIVTRCFAATGTTRHIHSWLPVELPHDWQSPDTIQGCICDNSLSGVKLNILLGPSLHLFVAGESRLKYQVMSNVEGLTFQIGNTYLQER